MSINVQLFVIISTYFGHHTARFQLFICAQFLLLFSPDDSCNFKSKMLISQPLSIVVVSYKVTKWAQKFHFCKKYHLNNRPSGLFLRKHKRGDGERKQSKSGQHNTTPHAIARSRVGSCSELDLRLLWDFTSSTTTSFELLDGA